MSGEAPRCTVVVPTLDRPAPLARCLAALARLDYPRERRELIVVDDGGAAPLDGVVAPYREALGLTLVRQPNAGPAAARNLALERASGELVAFTDDDCEPDPGWLRELARAWRAAPEALIGGRTIDGTAGNRWAAVSQSITDTAYDYFARRRRDLRFFASNNLAVGTAALRATGGFDPAFRWAEDRDLCHRWLAAGRGMAEAPAAIVVHRPALDARAFVRQHFGYGRGAWLYQRARAARGAGGVGFDPRFHLEVARRLLRRSRGLGTVAALARLVVWQSANTAGFAREAGAAALGRRSQARTPLPQPARDLDDAA